MTSESKSFPDNDFFSKVVESDKEFDTWATKIFGPQWRLNFSVRELRDWAKYFCHVRSMSKNTEERSIHLIELNKEAREEILRNQIEMWIAQGAKCARCNHIYKDVEDFFARDPKYGSEKFEEMFIDAACWKHPETPTKVVEDGNDS